MKKFAILAVVMSIVLSGCFGSSTSTDNAAQTPEKITGFHLFANDEFSLQVPDDWETLTPVNFTSDVPKNTLAAFRNNIKSPKFTASIAVIKNELNADIKPLDYVKALQRKMRTDLIDSKDVTLEESGGSLFIYVEGKESPDADRKGFIATAHVKGKTAYVVTGAFLSADSDALAEKIMTGVKSFSVK